MKIELWKDKAKKIPNPELFYKSAENFAEILAKENKEDRSKKLNRRTQLRKFYDELMNIESRAKRRTDAWEVIQALLHLLIAKAAYAKGRQLISDSFLNHIKEIIPKIKDYDDLKLYCDFFEAFMGFYRLHGPNN